jgi:hypothetical protein
MNYQTYGQALDNQAKLARLLAEMAAAVRAGRAGGYSVGGDWYAEALEALREAGWKSFGN